MTRTPSEIAAHAAGAVDRSSRREVRNPVLALPGLKAVLDLPEDQRLAICKLLTSMRDDARARAQQSWVKNKGPMAAYWKATGAYVEHIRRAVKRGHEMPLFANDDQDEAA